MKLVNCGCSFAHGYNGTQLDDYTPVDQPGLADVKAKGYQSAGWHLAKKHTFEYVDLARNGNSNEAILRTLRTYININGSKDIFVLIGWTHAFRREYITTNQNTNKGEFIQYREVPKNESFLSKFNRTEPMFVPFNERNNRPLAYDDHIEFRQYNIILQAQQMLTLFGIPYMMYNACGSEHESINTAVTEIKAQIDKQFFFKFDGMAFDEHLRKNGWYRHPDPTGHEQLAEMLSPMFTEIVDNIKEKQ